MRISDWSSDVCSSDLVGLTQNDIKRVIAYSTCSQLGYMFFALGVSAYSAGIFHLMTHAFFKALLFGAIYLLTDHLRAIGRASCRERVCQYVMISVVAVTLKKHTKHKRLHKKEN